MKFQWFFFQTEVPNTGLEKFATVDNEPTISRNGVRQLCSFYNR